MKIKVWCFLNSCFLNARHYCNPCMPNVSGMKQVGIKPRGLKALLLIFRDQYVLRVRIVLNCSCPIV